MTPDGRAQAVASFFRDDPDRLLAVVGRLRGSDRSIESTVAGGSMGTTLPHGVRIRIDLGGPPACAVGDVVAVLVGSTIVVHRVVGRGRGPRARDYVVTRGDAMLAPDPPVPRALVLGRVTAVSSGDAWCDVPDAPRRRHRGQGVRAAGTAITSAVMTVSPGAASSLASALHGAETAFRLRPTRFGVARRRYSTASRHQIQDGVPRWVRAVLRVDRAVHRGLEVETVALDRLLCMLVEPSQRAAVTGAAYGHQQQYLPGSQLYEHGLEAWELAAIRTPPFPPTGHLLLGGAGGGRELVAVSRLGYTVTAFDPAPVMVQAAREIAARLPGARVVQASYDDLVRHAAGEATPFDGHLGRSIDGVILGLGSFSHVVEEAERVALLRALRSIAPSAPVLLSFNLRTADADGSGRRTRLVRTVFDRVGVRTRDVPAGLGFTSFYGFRYALAEGELDCLAGAAGYEVSFATGRDFPHALLVPHPAS